LPLAASGKIKALAVTSLKRVAAAPDIPTVAESGMTASSSSRGTGCGAEGPAADITAKLQAEVAKALAQRRT
jgi:tripartite-type tricarboxylate transporter receptor subunit TctC